MGIRPTIAGAATISAEVEPERFGDVFGTRATEIAPQAPGAADFGKSAGHASSELIIPSLLIRYVESISVAPPHTYL